MDGSIAGSLNVSGNVSVGGALVGNIGSGGAPFPRPAYDSGWLQMAPSTAAVFYHLLGGSVDDYVVDLSVRYGSASADLTNRRVGGDTYWRDSSFHEYGVYWSNLNTTWIHVVHAAGDSEDAWARVRIWVVK